MQELAERLDTMKQQFSTRIAQLEAQVAALTEQIERLSVSQSPAAAVLTNSAHIIPGEGEKYLQNILRMEYPEVPNVETFLPCKRMWEYAGVSKHITQDILRVFTYRYIYIAAGTAGRLPG